MNNVEDGTHMPPISRFIALINNYPDTAPYVRQLCLFNPQQDDQIGLIPVLTKLANLSSLELDMFGGAFVKKWGKHDPISQMLLAVSTNPNTDEMSHSLRGPLRG